MSLKSKKNNKCQLSHTQGLLNLLARGEQEIVAGVGYDLDEILAEADGLLAEDTVATPHGRENS